MSEELGLVLGVILAVAGIGFLLFEGAVSVKLSASDIAGFAANAGFTGDDLVTAVAVALAESSGNPQAHGDQGLGSGRGSFGLWQIYSDAHPEYGPDFTQLYDPQTNANAAFAIYQAAGNRFTPWSTYKGGQYEAHLSDATAAVSA